MNHNYLTLIYRIVFFHVFFSWRSSVLSSMCASTVALRTLRRRTVWSLRSTATSLFLMNLRYHFTFFMFVCNPMIIIVFKINICMYLLMVIIRSKHLWTGCHCCSYSWYYRSVSEAEEGDAAVPSASDQQCDVCEIEQGNHQHVAHRRAIPRLGIPQPEDCAWPHLQTWICSPQRSSGTTHRQCHHRGETWQIRNHLYGGPRSRDLHGRPQLQTGRQLPVALQAEQPEGWMAQENHSLRWRWRLRKPWDAHQFPSSQNGLNGLCGGRHFDHLTWRLSVIKKNILIIFVDLSFHLYYFPWFGFGLSGLWGIWLRRLTLKKRKGERT